MSQSFEIIHDVIDYWYPKALQFISKPGESAILHQQLNESKSYSEWHERALKLDVALGNNFWCSDPQSRFYDYKLISALALRMNQLRSQHRFDELTEVIRSGLVRNIGSIGSAEMYTRAYAGTKVLIESYIQSVINSLESLSKHKETQQFFKDAKQSYGRTALVLHGGSVFGLCHLGIIKSLLAANLLPSVICGVTVGSIAAAYVCSLPESKIDYAISQLSTWALTADLGELNEKEDVEGDRKTIFTPEVLWFHKFVHDHLGNMTFEEAYAKSGRFLNILVLEEGENNGTFYNYLTTPKVVIRYAVLASIGSNMVPNYRDIELHIKDYEGNVRTDGEHKRIFLPANDKTFLPPRESPYARLAELFNVNNYIVSITRPYFAPFLRSDTKYRGQPKLWNRAFSLACVSIQYRVGQLAEWGLVTPWVKSMFIDEMIPKGFFQLNIVPTSESLVNDILLSFDSVNIWKKIKHWINLGERSVWPNMAIIYTRTKIEHTLNEICNSNITASLIE